MLFTPRCQLLLPMPPLFPKRGAIFTGGGGGQPSPSKQQKTSPRKETRNPQHPEIRRLVSCFKETHKNLFQKLISAPLVHMNKELLRPEHFCGQDVWVSEEPVVDQPANSQGLLQESCVRDDQAHWHVLSCLLAVAEDLNLPLLVISQLRFEDYLSDPCYQDVASNLPRPIDLIAEKKHRGDFDILALHPDYGFLCIEVKSVGDRFQSSYSESKKDKVVLEKMQKAIKQLEKSKCVLKHLMSDKFEQNSPRIRTTMAMPNLKSAQLERTLSANPEVKKELCQCLGIPDTADPDTPDPLELCLYEDIMSPKYNPTDVSAKVMTDLKKWLQAVYTGHPDWKQRSKEEENCIKLSKEDCIELAARLCGPATFAPSFRVVKPQVHSHRTDRQHYVMTLKEAVVKVGERFSRRVLHDDQIKVLKKEPPLMFVCGPPGTGKSVVLLLMACKWLFMEHHVHVTSTWSGSMAATHLIVFELKRQWPQHADRVHHHEFDLKEEGGLEDAVKTLGDHNNGELFIICDEAFGGREFGTFCTELKNNCKGLRLWAASVYHGYRPSSLETVAFSAPLRTPPVVTREVMQSELIMDGLVREYSTPAAAAAANAPCGPPQPCDGIAPFRIQHRKDGHSTSWPGECEQCGLELAEKLLELRSDGSEVTFQDMMVLSTYFEMVEEKRNEDEVVETPASGLVEGLRKGGVPVRVLGGSKEEKSAALAEVVAKEGPDAVVVADADTIRGLERQVAVWVETDHGSSASGDEGFGRLDAMSRTTAYLILVQ